MSTLTKTTEKDLLAFIQSYQPNPNQIYLITEARCKICQSEYRQLIEALYYEKHLGFRSVARAVSHLINVHFTSVEQHIKNHTKSLELEKVLSLTRQDMERYLTELRMMTDGEKADMVIDAGLLQIKAGLKLPTVGEAIKMLGTKYGALQNAADAELSHALAAKLESRQALGRKKQERLERTSSLKDSG